MIFFLPQPSSIVTVIIPDLMLSREFNVNVGVVLIGLEKLPSKVVVHEKVYGPLSPLNSSTLKGVKSPAPMHFGTVERAVKSLPGFLEAMNM